MKKSSIKKIYVTAIAIAVFLLILIFSLNQKEQTPHFKFLKENAPFICIEESNSQVRKTHYLYSFEADCNDIMAIAIKELDDMDYKMLYSLTCDLACSSWDDKNGYSTSVEFYKNYKLIEMASTLNNTTPFPFPFLHKELCCEDWMSIRITKHRKQNKLIFEIKQLFQLLRGSH